MSRKKESFFWTSYSDLMTSLFFIMLTLFVLVIVLLYKRMQFTIEKLDRIEAIVHSTEDLNKDYFAFKPEYKKYVLNVKCFFPERQSMLETMQADQSRLKQAGLEIADFLHKHDNNDYLLIIEGQASRNSEPFSEFNYELSFKRALTLMKFWKNNCQIDFGNNCEIQIAGSGDGRYNFGFTGGDMTPRFKELDALLMRDHQNEANNQRFVIHIIPKNIIENE